MLESSCRVHTDEENRMKTVSKATTHYVMYDVITQSMRQLTLEESNGEILV